MLIFYDFFYEISFVIVFFNAYIFLISY